MFCLPFHINTLLQCVLSEFYFSVLLLLLVCSLYFVVVVSAVCYCSLPLPQISTFESSSIFISLFFYYYYYCARAFSFLKLLRLCIVFFLLLPSMYCWCLFSIACFFPSQHAFNLGCFFICVEKIPFLCVLMLLAAVADFVLFIYLTKSI